MPERAVVGVKRNLLLLSIVVLAWPLQPVSSGSDEPDGFPAFSCQTNLEIEFSPRLDLFDEQGTAKITPLTGACAGIFPECGDEESKAACACVPGPDPDLCFVAQLLSPVEAGADPYLGSCLRAVLWDGELELTAGTWLSGTFVQGTIRDPGVATIQGVLRPLAIGPCGMERAICTCTITGAGGVFG